MSFSAMTSLSLHYALLMLTLIRVLTVATCLSLRLATATSCLMSRRCTYRLWICCQLRRIHKASKWCPSFSWRRWRSLSKWRREEMLGIILQKSGYILALKGPWMMTTHWIYRMAADLQNKTAQRWLHLHFRPEWSRKCVDFGPGSGSGNFGLAQIEHLFWHSVLVAAYRMDWLSCFMQQMKGKGLPNTLISKT